MLQTSGAFFPQRDGQANRLLALQAQRVEPFIRDGKKYPLDHVHAVLERDADNVFLSEVSLDGREASADLVGLIGLASGNE